jgi:hypothetical protein
MSYYNDKEGLKGKWWYRLLIALFWIIIIFSGIAPFLAEGIFNPFVDSITLVIINTAIMLLIRRVILYVVYNQSFFNKKSSSKLIVQKISKWWIFAVVSVFVLGIGAVLPWGYAYSDPIWGLSVDGIVILIIAILALICLLVKKVPVWIVLILGLAAGAIGVIDLIEVNKVISQIFGAKVGPGLYITILGSIGIIVSSVAEMSNKKD